MVAFGVVALATPAAAAGDGSLDQVVDEADSAVAGGYVEEVLVVADRLKKGDVPSQTIIVQTYSTLRRGKRLYNDRHYAEALPFLVMGAKRGFKWAQAMAGDIYMHGRGGVPRDIEVGMGWLGTAATPQTEPSIQTYFRQAMAEISPRQRNHIEGVVHRYREQWSARGYRVSCRRTVSESPAAFVNSLRLNRRLRCTFVDEVPVCREPWGGSATNPLNPAFQWICPPVEG